MGEGDADWPGLAPHHISHRHLSLAPTLSERASPCGAGTASYTARYSREGMPEGMCDSQARGITTAGLQPGKGGGERVGDEGEGKGRAEAAGHAGPFGNRWLLGWGSVELPMRMPYGRICPHTGAAGAASASTQGVRWGAACQPPLWTAPMRPCAHAPVRPGQCVAASARPGGQCGAEGAQQL